MHWAKRRGAEIDDCVVVGVLGTAACIGRRDGEQKLSISKRRRTLYGRAEIGNKNQKIQFEEKRSFSTLNITKSTDKSMPF